MPTAPATTPLSIPQWSSPRRILKVPAARAVRAVTAWPLAVNHMRVMMRVLHMQRAYIRVNEVYVYACACMRLRR